MIPCQRNSAFSIAAITDTYLQTGDIDRFGIVTTVAGAGPAGAVGRIAGAGPEISNIINIGFIYTDVGHSALDSTAAATTLMCP